MEEQIQELHRMIRGMRSDIADLKAETAQLRTNRDASETEILRLKNRCAELENKVHGMG